MCITEGELRKYFMGRADRMWTTSFFSLNKTFCALVSDGVDTMWVSVQCLDGQNDVNSFKPTRTSGGSDYESRAGSQMSPRPLQMLIVLHGGSVPIFDVCVFQVQAKLSFVVASLSFCSAHVSVNKPL